MGDKGNWFSLFPETKWEIRGTWFSLFPETKWEIRGTGIHSSYTCIPFDPRIYVDIVIWFEFQEFISDSG